MPAIAKLTEKQMGIVAQGNELKLTDEQQRYVVDEALRDYRDALSAKDKLHRDWKKYEDYYRNKQWKHVQTSDNRVKPTTNYIFSTIESMMPFLTNENADPIVLPTKPDDEELATSLTTVVKSILKKNKLNDKRSRVERSRLKLGTGIYKVYFDPIKYHGLGDISLDGVDLTNFFPDPEEPTDIQRGRFCLTANKRSLKYARDNYPEHADRIQPDQLYTEFQTFETQDITVNSHNDYVTIYEYWTKDQEQGLIHVVIAGQTLIRYQPHFYMHGKYPFVLGVDYPVEKTIWGMGETEQIIKSQDILNKLMQMVIENVGLANGQLLIDKTASGIENSKTLAQKLWEPGLVIPVDDIGSVKKLDGIQAPGWVISLIQEIKQDLELITGISPSYLGQATGSVTAASGILALQEQATARIRIKLQEQARMVEEIVEFIIAYIVEFYDDERSFRYIDENREPAWITVSGDSVAEQTPDGKMVIPDFDVTTEVGFDTPISRAYIEQQSLQLFQMGIIDAIEVMKTMNYPYKDEIIARLEQKQDTLRQMGGLPAGTQSPALQSQLAGLTGLENQSPTLPGGMNVLNTNSPQDAGQQQQQANTAPTPSPLGI